MARVQVLGLCAFFSFLGAVLVQQGWVLPWIPRLGTFFLMTLVLWFALYQLFRWKIQGLFLVGNHQNRTYPRLLYSMEVLTPWLLGGISFLLPQLLLGGLFTGPSSQDLLQSHVREFFGQSLYIGFDSEWIWFEAQGSAQWISRGFPSLGEQYRALTLMIRGAVIARFSLLESSSTAVLDPGAFLSALLLGDRSALDPRVSFLFREAGVLHILALSGFHLGLLMGLIRPISSGYKRGMVYLSAKRTMPAPWMYRGIETFASVLLLLILGLYCSIALPGPGLFRAALMVGVSQTGRMVKVNISVWESFWISFIVLLTLDPGYVGHWGFALSYLALGGLLLGSSPIQRFVRQGTGWFPGWYVSSGIAAVWGTLPFFLIFHPTMGLVLNGILLGPFLGWVVTLWAILGGLWLCIPVSLVQSLISLLATFTRVLLLSGRIIPAIQGEFVWVLGWGLWLFFAYLIARSHSWYGVHHHDRLRFPSVPPVFPGSPGFFHEKKVRTKLYG